MRWTEQRNFQACLHLLGTGGLDLGAITTRRVKFEDALPIYQTLGDGGSNDVGVVMEYGGDGRCHEAAAVEERR